MLHPDWDLIVISWAELGLGTSQPDGKHAKRAIPRSPALRRLPATVREPIAHIAEDPESWQKRTQGAMSCSIIAIFVPRLRIGLNCLKSLSVH